MKDNDYETRRHKLVLERISNARNIKELPNITLSNLAKFLADNVYFDKRHIPAKEFKPFIIKMIDNGYNVGGAVKDCFIDILAKHYADHSEEEFEQMYQKIIGTGRINNMFIEMSLRGQKIQDMQDELDLEKHKENLDSIKNASTVKEIDGIQTYDLESLIVKDTKNEIVDINKNKLTNLIYLIYNKKDYQEIDNEIANICKSYNLSSEDYYIMYNQVLSGIMLDKKISYVVEELRFKERQIKSIYKNEHLLVMEKINGAMDLNQLPHYPHTYALCQYLSANSKVDNNRLIPAEKFTNLVEILISGKGINSKVVKDELKKVITNNKLKVNSDLLHDKFSTLPRLGYLIEEISLIRKREKEFTNDEFTDIELYIVPTPNSPEHGGIHYTLFKNEVSNLDLKALVPNYNSLDELEEKVREISPSFKKIGGIILKQNERISLPIGSNLKFYRGKVGEESIAVKESDRLAKIEELAAKQNRLLELQAQKRAEFDEQQKVTAEQLKEIQQELIKLTTADDDVSYKKKGLKNE